MASVWLSQPSGISKLDGNLNSIEATVVMAGRAKAWARERPNRSIDLVSSMEIHLFDRGRPVAHLYIEPYSPPTKPIGGDIYRRAGAQK